MWGFLTVGQTEVKVFVDQMVNAYPAELEIKVQNGKVTSNVQEPYFIPLSENENRSIVVDTKTPFSATQFNQYKTTVWIAKDAVFIRGSNGVEIKTYDLSQMPGLTVNKALVNSIVAKISPWLNLITPLAIAGILLGFYLVHTSRLIYLLFLALLILLLTKLLKKPLSYSRSYKVGLYAVTLGFLAELIFEWIGFSGFPFMFTLISLSVVLVNFLSTPKEVQAR